MQRCDAETRRWEAMLLLDSVHYVGCAGWEVRVDQGVEFLPACRTQACTRVAPPANSAHSRSAIEDAFGLRSISYLDTRCQSEAVPPVQAGRCSVQHLPGGLQHAG